MLEVPLSDLVLLRLEILLGAGPDRFVLLQFERGTVDPVARAEGRSEDEPSHERGLSTVLQILVEDVRRVGPQVRTEEVPDRRLRELAEVLGELMFGVAPREVRVALRESELGQAIHHLRPRERLGQEDRIGMVPLDLPDQPFPEPERLRVRVVDAEDPHPVPDPELHDRRQLLPQLLPGLRLEIDRVDVLVLLRWVLRVLDGAVGPVLEPLGVRLHPRVVGRALEGDVEGHLDPVLRSGRLDEVIEVLDCPQVGVHRRVAALAGADRPRAPGVVLSCGRGVVLSLAVGVPDRMDRRQVQHVEAELRYVGKPRGLDVLERPVTARPVGGRPREELVPAAEPGPLRIDEDLELALERHRVRAIGRRRHRFGQFVVERSAVVAIAQTNGGGAQRLAHAAPGPFRCGVHELRPDEEVGVVVRPGVDLLLGVAPP